MEDLQNIVPLIGITIGITLLVALWVGIALWLFADADRYGLIGWLWAFIGIATGPFGLILYLIIRRIFHPADRTLLTSPQDDPLPPPALTETPTSGPVSEPSPVAPLLNSQTIPPAAPMPPNLPAQPQPRARVVVRARQTPAEGRPD